MSSFYITLSSNFQAGNTASKFTVFLPTFIQLSMDYEVALTYIQGPGLKGTAKHFSAIVQCAIVRNQIVNDKYKPLLAVVPVKNITDGKAYSAHSVYCDVLRKDFDRLDFDVKDFAGRTILFNEGITTIQLHFRS